MYRLLFWILPLLMVSCESVDSDTKDVSEILDFEWDFDEEKKIVYSFSQTTNVVRNQRQEGSTGRHFFTGKGVLGIDVKENNMADLSLTSLNVKSIDQFSASYSADTSFQTLPPLVLQDMSANGKFSDPAVDVTFNLFFPLPTKRLGLGESCVIPMQFPFNANGSRLIVKGQNTLTFTGYEEMDGVNCAVLVGVVEIAQLDVPEELNGEFAASNIGKGTYYFDVDRGVFVGSDLQMTMKAFIDSGNDDEEVFSMFMDMTSENQYEVRLKEIEE